MLSLYGEIKSYVERIKQMLNKALEVLTTESPNEKTSEQTRLLVHYLMILGDDKTHLRAQFTKIKSEQSKSPLPAPDGSIVDQLSALHERTSLDFYLSAIRDYKTLFLGAQKSRTKETGHRHSTAKVLTSFKNDQEEKQEIREFKKFIASLTTSYFSHVQTILNAKSPQDNSVFKGFVGMFNYQCQLIDAEAGFEYKVYDVSKKSDVKLFMPVDAHCFKSTDLASTALRISETAIKQAIGQ